MFLLFRRVSLAIGQMERLVARFETGRLWRLAPRPVARASACSGDGGPGGEKRIWPGRFGWLVRLAGWQAAGYGSQLRHLLQTPEMVALLTAAPQAGRILQPICRMLAIESALLRPGVPATVAVSREPVAKKIRTKPAPLDWGRIPLPKGVLSAARRQGYGKRKDYFGAGD
jgi:hypothetical protein